MSVSVTKLLVRVESLEYNDLASDEREEIDFTCSDDRFCQLAIKALRVDYPQAYIDVTTRSVQGPTVITVFGVAYENEDYPNICADIQNTLELLYATGDFWCLIGPDEDV